MYPVDDILGTALGTEGIGVYQPGYQGIPQQDLASVMQQTIVQNYYNFSNCPIRNSSADAEKDLANRSGAPKMRQRPTRYNTDFYL